MMRSFRSFAAAALLCLVGAHADAFRIRGSNVAVVPPPAQSIVSITPAAASFVGGAGSANRTAFVVTVNMSAGPPFAGSLSLIGPDAGMFKLVGSTVTACAPPQAPCGDVAAASYNISVVADQPGATGSPATQPVAVTATVPGSATFITTATFQNITGEPGLPSAQAVANWPLQRGQAFKYGEVPSSSHVEIRMASGSTCNGTLLDYQWDDISTRVENGMDGSWRHAVFTVRLPSVTSGSYVSLAFCKVAGTYSPGTSTISLADICSAHPLALDLNDIRNQDDSVRGTGSATWSLCSYVSTTGRNAPLQYANGQIRRGWLVRGEPVYATTSAKDPLLYVMAYVDAYSVPGSPNTIDRVKHVVRVANAWMQVASGTAGLAGSTTCNGSTCPVGFTSDPQMVSYTPVFRDGATTLVDYDGIFGITVDANTPNTVTRTTSSGTSAGGNTLHFATDATTQIPGVSYGTLVSNTSVPGSIPAGCFVTDPDYGVFGYQLSCTIAGAGVGSGNTIRFDTYFAQVQANNPSGSTASFADDKNSYFQSAASSGDHLYYGAGCFRYSTTGTPPSGMTNNTQYYAMPVEWRKQPFASDRFQLLRVPTIQSGGLNDPYVVNVTTRGSGTQRLKYCVNHRKFSSWYTADIYGRSRWTGALAAEPFETTYDAGTVTGERLYWERTGVVPPIELGNEAAWETKMPYSGYEYEYTNATRQYYPNNITLAAGGSGGGQHSYIGILAEWSARWWLDQDPLHINQNRQFALDGESFPMTTVLSEATGRIPPINNGPPAGTGTGTGTAYATLGPVYPLLSAGAQIGLFHDVAQPLRAVPSGSISDQMWWYGPWPNGIFNDHQSAYNYYPFILFGDRHFLDQVYIQGNRTGTVQYDEQTSAELRPNRSFTFPPSSGTPPSGITFHGILYPFNTFSQGPRAAAWMERALALGAALGADGTPERLLMNDYLTESGNFWFAMAAHKDCTSPVGAATGPYTAAPGVWSHSPTAGANGYANQGFMDGYNAMAEYVNLMLTGSPSALDRLQGAYLASYAARFGTSGWPNSVPPIYGGAFWYFNWSDMAQTAFGKCRAAYVGGTTTQLGIADANVVVDTSNGNLIQFRQCPLAASCGSATMYNLTAGDKVKMVLAPQNSGGQGYGDSVENLTTGSMPGLVNNGPNELPTSQWYCIVDINNSTGFFHIAPSTGTPPNECSSVGATITSYTGLVTDDSRETNPFAGHLWAVPPGFTDATTWFLKNAMMFRLQNPVFTPNANYVFWAENGASALVSAGIPGASAYQAQAVAAGITIPDISGSNASFDWDPTIVPPRKP